MEKCLAIGAKIVWIGRADKEAPIYLELFQTHAAQLYGAQGHSGYGTFWNVIRLMASGKIDMRKIVTGRHPLGNFNEAVERLSKRIDAKILIKC
jgi:threonine dehydrogenase-like Zn-dependent dehydrogenase